MNQNFSRHWHVAADRWAARLTGWGESRWFFPAVLTGVLAILFWDAVGPDCLFAYRDSLHFYPPIYRLVADEWLAGRVPLWNPLLNNGQPLAGMPTSGAFYPPQVVLAILLPDGQSLNVYVIAHLVLAASGSYRLARYLGQSRPAASLAGICYAFGGSVLLQIYNPIYAAGAAWLVWAVLTGWKLLDRGTLKDFLGLACCLAMTVLCGEPQSGYHAGLVLGLRWLWLGRRNWRGLFALAAAAGLAGLLALPQIALAVEFTKQTSRSFDLAPHSLWELPAFFSRGSEAAPGVHWYDIFIGRPPEVATHYEAIYAFHLVPWRIVEFFWPDFAGVPSERWTLQLGLEGSDVWFQSLYAGVLAAVFVVVAAVSCRHRSIVTFWVVLCASSLLLAMGAFGVVGIVRSLAALGSGAFDQLGYRPGDEVGGLYWLLTLIAPGYAGFRYPAKWLTVCALAFAQASAFVATDLPASGRLRRLVSGLALTVGATVLVAALAVFAFVGEPFTRTTVGIGGLHAALVAVAGGLWIWFWPRLFGQSHHSTTLIVPLLVLTAAEVAVANVRNVSVGSFAAVWSGSAYLEELKLGRKPDLASVSDRLRIVTGRSQAMFGQEDPEHNAPYQGRLLFSNIPLLRGVEAFSELGTAVTRDASALCSPIQVEGVQLRPRRTYDLAGVEFFVIQNDPESFAQSTSLRHAWSAQQLTGEAAGPEPGGSMLPHVELPLPGEDENSPPAAVIFRNESALPRLRVVRQIGETPRATHAGWVHWIETLKRIAYPNPDVPDLINAALVESSAELGRTLAAWQSAGRRQDIPRDRCRIIVDEPQRLIAEVDLIEPGLVVLADSYSDDWQLAVSRDGGPAEPAAILRVNQIHRGCGLPAGRHRLEFRYHSQTFARTWPVAALAWAGLLMAAASGRVLPASARKGGPR